MREGEGGGGRVEGVVVVKSRHRLVVVVRSGWMEWCERAMSSSAMDGEESR